MDPELSCSGRVGVGFVFADFHDLHSVIMLDIVIDQLLLEAQLFTTYLNPVTEVINLKQEQNVIFVYLLVVIADELVDGRYELFLVRLDGD